jgi:hypothetical protein
MTENQKRRAEELRASIQAVERQAQGVADHETYMERVRTRRMNEEIDGIGEEFGL